MTEHINTEIENLALFGGKYLTFKMGNEEFGIEILRVQEIVGMMDITKLPMTYEYVRGVVNLRGVIVPTIDLRMRFGMNTQQDTEKTCIIVVELAGQNRTVKVGMVVDEVAEVLDVPSSSIQPKPSFGLSCQEDFIKCVGVVNDQVKILLDIDSVLSRDKVESLKRIAQKVSGEKTQESVLN
ncbi:MAG: chemotaxis protein CheW [Deltaproteobacteria bacterium]|nr:chemotaxis protein CheW [Deltaproteobacteria bacterium]